MHGKAGEVGMMVMRDNASAIVPACSPICPGAQLHPGPRCGGGLPTCTRVGAQPLSGHQLHWFYMELGRSSAVSPRLLLPTGRPSFGESKGVASGLDGGKSSWFCLNRETSTILAPNSQIQQTCGKREREGEKPRTCRTCIQNL